ncbi:hypothetical protein [Nitrosomonas ureae]|uniref:O-antigen ligase n=1 Tax=Nitrosomonas ureae TaxID=44577 RepID=A0A0S3AMM3_9PROT|nr:hypothetical protein [Nitrosomonas ureae]ALQ52256.1 hypothetical protein ATY38_14170 [Nitrosomonas ureae]PXX10166.1 hypothetical protein C8R27_13416 [Nitrosomonas ureae]SDU24087.1 hypothetical protein SAMN05216406_13816 [Nitrosomonas ureae]SEQ35086.1 hypothetical protein SAMN05421510_104017 [Nitrosomonas ureae]SOD20829.1 hypothetical protein SAMN06297164_2889 [Nitrosomonas ureae]
MKAEISSRLFNNLDSKALIFALLLLSVLVLSILSGILAASGNLILLVPLLVLYGVFFILAAPVAWTVWILFWGAFLVTGPSAYFIRFSQLQWFTVLVSAALLLPLLLHLLRARTSIKSVSFSGDLLGPIILVLLVLFSTVIDRPYFSEFVNASRYYLLMWPLMLVIMFGLITDKMIMQLWKALMIVAVLQFPMAIYQYFFVVPGSTRTSRWDAVIGTFHGVIEGGGDSAAMAIMLLIAMLTAIALWREGKLNGLQMALVVLFGFFTLGLAEVKAAVMLLPVVIGLYYRRELLKRPVEAIVVIIGAVLLVGVLFTFYEKLHYGDVSTHTFKQNQVTSTYDRVMRAIDPEAQTYDGRELGRVNLLLSWWNINIGSGDLQHSLFGYGMGATYESRIGIGELVDRFPYKINTSSSLILLWEIGILGHLVFLFILLLGVKASERAANNDVIPEIHRIFLRIGTVGLLLLVLTMPYKNFHLYSNPIQFLMMLMLGQAAYWSRFLNK